MTVWLFMLIMLSIVLLVSGLSLARYAIYQQEELILRLHWLTVLSRQRQQTWATIRALEAMDDHPDLLLPLYESLKADLLRIARLDPDNAEIPDELKQVNQRLGRSVNQQGADNQERRTRLEKGSSLGSQGEITEAGKRAGDAMNILRRLSRYRKITVEQFASGSRRLRYLSALIGVNSNIRMARMALAEGDRIKALSCFRRAESILQLGIITGREYSDKQNLIDTERQQIHDEHASDKGVFLLTVGE